VEITPSSLPWQAIYKLMIGSIVPRPIGWLAGNGYCRVAPAMFDLARPASQIKPS
jgi:hypothetical protein